MADDRPLVLDVDGTFLRTDLLLECLWAGLGRAPLATARAVLRHRRDRAALKAALTPLAALRTGLMPVHPDLALLAKREMESGREVVLASASDRPLVAALAADHRLSRRVFASDGTTNLKGAAKAEALVAAFGARGFDYAGDCRADLPVWRQAAHALVVGPVRGAASGLRAAGQEVTEIAGGWGWRDLLRALRPHQWVKNVLLLLPMVAAHDFTLSTLLLVALGMVAFSAAASSIYVVNDLLDLEADRLHRTKRHRPFASGAVPIGAGMAAALLLGLLALAVATALGAGLVAAVAIYMALSLAYSLALKRMRWIDVFTLATLYTLRVVAGAAASGVEASVYMLVFVFPIFVCLGCVKRLTELAVAPDAARLPGRGYAPADRGDLLNMAVLGGVGALVIFALYAFTPQGDALYPTRWILLSALLPMALWLWRMIRLGYYGRMHHDPIVFALRDLRGLGLLMLALALMFYAAGLWRQWFG